MGHTHLVLFLVTSTLHKQRKIMEFSYWWEFLLESSVVKAKIYFESIKDSCDGSGLNTIESSKGSHPQANLELSSHIVQLS